MDASVVTSNVAEVASQIAEVVTSVASASGIAPKAITASNAASIIKMAIAKLPTSFYIKIGLVTGLAVFSAVVLIRRWMKQRKFKDQAQVSGTLFTDYKETVDVDPIDEYLGMGYSDDPDKFDGLDPLMKKVAKNVKPGSIKKLSKSKKNKLRRIWTEYHRGLPEPEYVTWARGVSKNYLAEVDKAARECGLDVEYTIDDNMPLERRRRFNEKLGFPWLDDIG